MAGALTAAIAAAFSGGAATDPYFEYTTLLLPGNGTNGAQNNTFLDASTNNFTITRNGNTTQGTFSPFSQTGWGNYFGGSGNYLSVADNAAFEFGSGDFTIEGWINVPDTTNYAIYSKGNFGTLIALNTDKTITFYASSNGSSFNISNNTTFGTLTLNTWNHFAVSREGNNIRLFLNGVLGATVNTSATLYDDSGVALIGRWTNGAAIFHMLGYISNLRLVKGRAVYTSAFDPPTSPLGATSGGQNPPQGTETSLLTCQSNRFIDNSTNNFTITRNGSPSVQAFSPFNPTSSWSATTNGGSGYFDGTGDYVAASSAGTAANLGTTWTVECWLYPTSVASTAGIVSINTGTTNQGINIYRNGTTILVDNGGSAGTGPSGGTLIANAWQHLAIVADGTNTKIWLNGSQAGSTYTGTVTSGTPTQIWVGSAVTGLGLWSGYIANARIVKGTAVYTGAFTPPIAPLSTSGSASASAYSSTTNVNTSFASSETSLLLNFTNAGIYDATSKNDLETVGNAQISTTQSKWGGSSMAFDGTGDYLQAPDTELLEFGSGDFTIETWVRFAALPSSGAWQTIISKFDNSTQKSYSFYVYNNAGTYQLYFTYTTNGSTNVNPVANGITVTTNTWYHYAVCRSGANLRIFIDGTQVGSTYNISTDSIFGGTYPVQVGASTASNVLNGFLQDTRVTKGYARYTANFTPPTAAFPTL